MSDMKFISLGFPWSCLKRGGEGSTVCFVATTLLVGYRRPLKPLSLAVSFCSVCWPDHWWRIAHESSRTSPWEPIVCAARRGVCALSLQVTDFPPNDLRSYTVTYEKECLHFNRASLGFVTTCHSVVLICWMKNQLAETDSVIVEQTGIKRHTHRATC